jgi:hypothetical protein
MAKGEVLHTYRNELGEALYQVVVKKNGTAAVRRPDPKKPSEFVWNLDDTRRVLYRLNEVYQINKEEGIFFAPDEKQADALSKQGLFATTNVFGPGHWDSGYASQLAGRPVVVIVTSDPQVHDHAERVALSLAGHATSVRLLELPQGVEAFFKGGKTLNDLLMMVDELSPWSPSSSGPSRVGPYESTSAGMFWYKTTQHGTVRTALTNFNALITHEIEIHDGSGEPVRHFEITAKLKGRQFQVSLPAMEFGAMNWVPQNLGAEAIIYPGNSAREHSRTAIQLLSGSVPKKLRYTHTGWTKAGGKWLYLHNGGAIGASVLSENGPEGTTGPHSGSTPDLGSAEILLPDALRKYVLPQPPTGERLCEAVRASLRLLDVAPHRITVPLLGAVYRSPLGQANLSLYLVGPTGVRKSEVASRGQQHFGPEMDAMNLPGAWSSTANALEAVAYLAKDALLVIDDFCPRGAGHDIERLNAQADRIYRGQGNNAGRQRMRSDQTLAATKYPRGLVLSTGEVVPTGQSLRGRLVITDVGPADVDLQKLTQCQQDGQAGLYAEALAGYIQWLAPQYDGVRDTLKRAVAALRPRFIAAGQHPRSPENLAHLAYGFDQFLTFAQSVGAIACEEKQRLGVEASNALREADERQMEYQLTSDPAQMFIEALRAALRSGRAHLICDHMTLDEDPETWGWAGEANDTLQAQGEPIGWLEGDDVFLQPEKAFTMAQQMAKELGEPLGVAQPTLQKRLRQKGLLKSWDYGRERNTVRKTFGTARQTVLHLDAAPFQDAAQQAQSAQNTEVTHGS